MVIEKNKYKEFSTEKVNAYKEGWDKDFLHGVGLVDYGEIFFLAIGILVFLFLPHGFKISFVVLLMIIFYWFRIKWTEKKIIEGKKFLILGAKFINEDFRGRGVTKDGAEPHYRAHQNGFENYIDFWDT